MKTLCAIPVFAGLLQATECTCETMRWIQQWL